MRIDLTDDHSIAVYDGDAALLRYDYAPDTAALESPKPFLHPLRTRAGREVSLFRPHDHVWHKGIAWALPHVGDQNFWGGPTYIDGRSYVQLPNNGVQRTRGIPDVTCDAGGVVIVHGLDWITEDGRSIIAETRVIRAVLLSDDAWMLEFTTAMTNVSDDVISFGSPTTRGRENAGYGGLFWRGPRSFTGGTIVSPLGAGGDEMRGERHEWLGFTGRHDGSGDESTLLIVDHPDNPRHPPQWFARSEDFACLNPAPFFSEEFELASGSTLVLRYGVGISDDGVDGAGRVAALVRERMTA